jgi:hypothetical protein
MAHKNRIISVLVSIIIAIFIISPWVKADLSLDSIAESYVKLVLRVGLYDEYMVDSYFGPVEWKPSALPDEDMKPPYDKFLVEAEALAGQLQSIDTSKLIDLPLLRYRFLDGQIAALIGRIKMLTGVIMPFDVETRTMYDVELPPFDMAFYDSLLQELDGLLPGEGSVSDRLNALQAQMKVPPDKVEYIFRTGMNGARNRVSQHISIPAADSVSIEVVHDKWWTADCRYRGGGHSHMQFNVDSPFYLDEAISYPCHELYPGHHLSYLYISKYLLESNDWVEFSLVPCFSPFTGMLEGVAEYGIDLTFPKDEWIEFVKSSLCPIAGIDTSLVETYYNIWKLKYRLYSVESYIARRYLLGEIDSTEAKAQLMHYAIYAEDEVDDRIGAYDSYRSYVVTYYIGKDLVRQHIEAVKKTDDRNARWQAFDELLKTPLTPANLLSESN